ncbi:IclR family transcriptional regulator domain-containing protein [Nocardia tengchongensis]
MRALAIPYMNRLSAQVGRNVGLSVRQQREVLCIERVSAPGVFSAVPRSAERLPLHRSAAGLVLLAYAPNTVQRAMFSSPCIRAHNPARSPPPDLSANSSTRSGGGALPTTATQRIRTRSRFRSGRIPAPWSRPFPPCRRPTAEIRAMCMRWRELQRT